MWLSSSAPNLMSNEQVKSRAYSRNGYSVDQGSKSHESRGFEKWGDEFCIPQYKTVETISLLQSSVIIVTTMHRIIKMAFFSIIYYVYSYSPPLCPSLVFFQDPSFSGSLSVSSFYMFSCSLTYSALFHFSFSPLLLFSYVLIRQLLFFFFFPFPPLFFIVSFFILLVLNYFISYLSFLSYLHFSYFSSLIFLLPCFPLFFLPNSFFFFFIVPLSSMFHTLFLFLIACIFLFFIFPISSGFSLYFFILLFHD